MALQMRTGKMYDVLNKYRKAHVGEMPDGHVLFARWLDFAMSRLIAAARAAAKELDGEGGVKARFYVASDIFNSGWKGGETCLGVTCAALEKGRERLETELAGVYRFVPEEFDVKEDVMGFSGAVDAAVCYLAQRFVFITPSSLGSWVQFQRKLAGRSDGTTELDGLEGAEQSILDIWEERRIAVMKKEG